MVLIAVIILLFAGTSSAFLQPNCLGQRFYGSSLTGSNYDVHYETKKRFSGIVMNGMLDSLFDDDYLDDDEETIDLENSLTEDEKKEIIKAYFNRAFNNTESKPDEVHIILFNPNTEREGAHSINILGKNVILAFESQLECVQFSLYLKEQDFFEPVPQQINLDALEMYCEKICVDVQVVPKGAKLTPPSRRVFNLDVNPNLEKEIKQLDYLFQISESDIGREAIEDEDIGTWE